MARYYSYGRRRYGRRYYRRGYRRYGGSSLRRYRSVQLNDNETKVMTFSSVYDASVSLNGSATGTYSPLQLLAGSYRLGSLVTSSESAVTAACGRPFFAGMMFDRLRFRSLSVTIRPKAMPTSTATNYTLYAAWDRYGTIADRAGENSYSIRTDPSAKQVVWTPGGSGTPLRTWIYSTRRDRYQYFPIYHDDDLTGWNIQPRDAPASYPSGAEFCPYLLLAIEAVTSGAITVQFSLHARVVVEFQGGYSNTTLNPHQTVEPTALSSPLEQRIAALESKYNSNPADNNDDLVSVLNELSNPQ